jgi:hypothetical protein
MDLAWVEVFLPIEGMNGGRLGWNTAFEPEGPSNPVEGDSCTRQNRELWTGRRIRIEEDCKMTASVRPDTAEKGQTSQLRWLDWEILTVERTWTGKADLSSAAERDRRLAGDENFADNRTPGHNSTGLIQAAFGADRRESRSEDSKQTRMSAVEKDPPLSKVVGLSSCVRCRHSCPPCRSEYISDRAE